MGETKNLVSAAAIEKMKELANNKICMFCTRQNGEIITRPMDAQQVDDEGNLWFMSRRGSDKNNQVDADNWVYLLFMDTGKQHYLSLTGRAEILVDKKKTEEIWDSFAKAWFKGGKDDPEITLLKVVPQDGHYWDTKNGSFISLMKIALATVSGKEMDGGIEGDLMP